MESILGDLLLLSHDPNWRQKQTEEDARTTLNRAEEGDRLRGGKPGSLGGNKRICCYA